MLESMKFKIKFNLMKKRKINSKMNSLRPNG